MGEAMERNFSPDGRDAAGLLRVQEISRYRIALDDADPGLRLLAQLAVQAAGGDLGGITLVHDVHVAVVTGAGLTPQ